LHLRFRSRTVVIMGGEVSRQPGRAKEPERKNAASGERAPRVAKDMPSWAAGAMEMQRKAGNRATASALLRMGQAKLTVGAADDRYEREADAAASEVVSRLRAARTASPVPPPPEEEAVEAGSPALSQVQRKASPVIGREGGDLDAATETAIKSARHGGRPLPEGRRRSMEAAFGADFGGVKVHSGPAAHALNKQVGAIAFTVGSDIFLGRSAPDVTSARSEGILAHELAHTVQQGGSPPLPDRDEPAG
jgi:nucleoid-associated protein YgaU